MDEAAEKKRKKLKSLFNKALVNFSEYDSNWYYKIINAYGGTRNDPWPYKELLFEDMPVLFECIKAMPEKKVRLQTMLHNLYFMLNRLSQPLSFGKVEKLVDDIRNKDKMPTPKYVYEGNVPEERISVQVVADLTDAVQVKQLITPIFENIDAYVEKWRLHKIYYRIDPPRGSKEWATEETGLLKAATAFPGLHPMLEVIIRKIIEANKIYPLYTEYGSMGHEWWRTYTGYAVIAYFSASNPQKYDSLLLEYLQDIETESAEYMGRLLYHIQRCWGKTNIPGLPLTFGVYPQLAEVID